MIILGIETSCDETSAAIIEDGRKVISNIISSQADLHSKYGGVVPEVASRYHIEAISAVVDESLKAANIELENIDAIAVTVRPGLIGALLVGVSYAKALAYATGKPLYPVNHLMGHIKSVFLDQPPENIPSYPYLALVVSGGHSQIYKISQIDGKEKTELLSSTLDDSSGEAFDKGAKILGLPYPGGQVIDNLAKTGSKTAYSFPKPVPDKKIPHMSFSGLKTSLLNLAMKMSKEEIQKNINNICASYQEAIIEMIIRKTILVSEEQAINQIVIAGGVSANSRLRDTFDEISKTHGIKPLFPLKKYTTDNAAMIAAQGYSMYKNGFTLTKEEFLKLDANPAFDG